MMRLITVQDLFSPLAYTGCKLWVDGPSVSGNDGDAIQTWSDRSGLGNNATQATAGARPLLRKGANGVNGLAVLEFDTTDDYMTVANFVLNYLSNKTFTVFFAGNFSSAEAGLAHSLGGNTPRLYMNTGAFSYNTLNTISSAGTGTRVSAFRHSGSAQEMWVNGASVGTGAQAQQTFTGNDNLHIAWHAGGIVRGGKYGEIIAYQPSLTDDQVRYINQYLMRRWGVAA